MVKGSLGWPIGPGAGKVIAQENLLQSLKAHFRQQHLSDPIADTKTISVAGVPVQTMGVGALDTVHTAGVFRLGTAVKGGGSAPPFLLQVSHFQGMEMGVLGVGNLGLSAEGQALQGHPVAGIGMGGDHQPPSLVNDPVSGQDIGGSPHFSRASIQLVRGNIQVEQNIFQFADGGLF